MSLILDTEIYWKNEVPASKVEIGNTIACEFHTMKYDENERVFKLLAEENITAAAFLKNASDLSKVLDLDVIPSGSNGIFNINVPFDFDKVCLNKDYFVEFQWEYSGIKKLIREKIRVVDNIPEMRRI